MAQSKCLNITGILALLVGFFFLNTACTNTSTGAEEDEIEVIEDQNLRLTSAEPGYSEGNLRFTRFATTNLNAQRMRVRTTVNVSAAGETQRAVARGYAQFTARATEASLFADINWKGTMLSAINLSSKTQMIVRLRVREINPHGGNGPVLFTETLDSDGIGSGLKALETLNVNDRVSESYHMNLKKGQAYRVEVELECNLRVDIISFSLVDCNAESSDRGVFVNELKVMY
ncbi:MAG: hypothetical protein EA391_00035 [Balneolaceae bacterium]|nr:MAG: hypothetical protein EA391_00035 [Balneolaceae bacterium]